VIPIPGVPSESDGSVHIDSFLAFVNKTLVEYDDKDQGGIEGDVEAFCKVDVEEGIEFKGQEEFRKKMFAFRGLSGQVPN
jgi:hypothetical protein